VTMKEVDLLNSWVSSAISAPQRAELAAVGAGVSVESLLQHCQRIGLLPDIDAEVLRRHVAVRIATKKALLDYEPLALPLRVNLFVATEPKRLDGALGWAHLLPERQLELTPIGGTHHSIVASPHVEHLGAAITKRLRETGNAPQETPERQYAPRIVLQNGLATAPPLILVPGAGASVTQFFQLTQALDLDIPIYGLQPRGLDGKLLPHHDVSSAAAAYVRVVREVLPADGCHLLGHSYGGWVAMEMAEQLRRMGVPVRTLVLLDSEPPTTSLACKEVLSSLNILMSLIRHFEMSAGESLGLERAHLEGLSQVERVALLLSRLIRVKLLPPQTEQHTLEAVIRVFNANVRAAYRPTKPYSDKVHFVFASGSEKELHWDAHAPLRQVWMSGGNHMTLLNMPHVRQLAEWLRLVLRDRPA
jgi:thioesterase domain-containing protein